MIAHLANWETGEIIEEVTIDTPEQEIWSHDTTKLNNVLIYALRGNRA